MLLDGLILLKRSAGSVSEKVPILDVWEVKKGERLRWFGEVGTGEGPRGDLWMKCENARLVGARRRREASVEADDWLWPPRQAGAARTQIQHWADGSDNCGIRCLVLLPITRLLISDLTGNTACL